MNTPLETPETAAQIEVYSAEMSATYSIETAASISQISRHHIAVYCKEGFVSPLLNPDQEGWFFDDEAVRRLRRIEELRTSWDLNSEALKLVVTLMAELDHLRDEVRFLRGR